MLNTPRRPDCRWIVAALLLFAIPACAQEQPATTRPAAASSADIPAITLTNAFPKLSFTRPIYLTHDGASADHVYVIEQPGRILRIENRPDVTEASTFLDIRPGVHTRHNEEGLLGLAFHPAYAQNRHFYVYYSADTPRRGVVARFTANADDPSTTNPDSETIILEVEQPWGNHNGATVLFGPDGYLYVSLGDGGAANDPNGAGQDRSNLLGTIIRIDVDSASDGKAYAVPSDNPFVGEEGVRPEIWAYGLRNVWRMSFDRETGDLWAGDVGQNRWEEIDVIVPGGNYGWNIREGAHAFKSGEADGPMIDPVVDHPRSEAWSITGGYVYRGTKHPALDGVYLYADYVTRRVWGLRYEDGAVTSHREVIPPTRSSHVASFGEDAHGELYLCAFDKIDRSKGQIYRIGAR